MRHFFKTLPKNIINCYKGKNLFWQILMVALTYLLVVSGFDWAYYLATRNSLVQMFLFPAVIIGGFFPFIVFLAIFIIGLAKKSFQIMNLGWALGQAALLGLGISSFYKVWTGRVPPPHHFEDIGRALMAVTDISHGFRFGILRGGAFNGWPSSHTTVAFAMALTLIALYPKNKAVKYLSLLYASYVGIGVSVSIHWFSDFVAGIILGTVIGTVVGRSFWERYSAQR